MFKKEPRVKALSNLKNSERKKLQSTLQKQLDVPDFKFESNVIKQTNFVSSTTQGTIFTNDQGNVPILFKEKHGETLYPTVFCCWKYPNLLPIILTHDFVIEEHIFNGANLMISGTLPPFDSRLKKGVLCGIASRTSPDVILAVGKIDLPDLTEYNSTGVIGKTGVAVNVMHHFEDGLFPSFKVKLEPPKSVGVVVAEQDDPSTIASENIDGDKNINTRENSVVSEVASELESLKIEDVDYFMTRALYFTITQDTKIELPIFASNFISNHIMKNLPAGLNNNEVNVKKSSWKKTSKYLKHFEKLGFLKLKGKDDDLVVIKLNKEKDELKNFVPYKAGNGSNSGGMENGTLGNKENKDKKSMYFMKLYKPNQSIKEFMRLQHTKQLYSQNEIKDTLNQYITDTKLVNEKDKRTILMNDLLYSFVNTNVKKPKFNRIIPRSQILEPLIVNNFNEYYQIYNSDDGPLFKSPKKGKFPHIHVVTEMKIGRKIITRVNNFEVFNIDATQLSHELKKLCSGSATMNDTVHDGTEVQVQGPHGPLIMDYLNNKMGIPSGWIEFENKLKKKKKKTATH